MALRMGIVGAGAIGRQHADAMSVVGVALTGVADVNASAAEAMAGSYAAGFHTGDPQALFNREDVDAVVIGVPNKFHKDLAIGAMQAGKDVLLEKPMAMTVAECREINAVAQQTGKLVQLGFNHRFSSVAETARSFVRGGALGQVYHAKANYYRRRGIPGLGGWFTTKAVSGGGPLIDIAVHVVDLVMHLMDQPKPLRVSGKTYAHFGPRMKDYLYENMWAGPPKLEGVCDVEDSAHALIRLEGGATLELNATWAGNFPDESVQNIIGLFGDRGGVTFELAGQQVKVATEAHGHNADITPKLRPNNRMAEQLRGFAEYVETRQPAVGCTGDQGQRVQAIIDAIYASSAADREVEVDLS